MQYFSINKVNSIVLIVGLTLSTSSLPEQRNHFSNTVSSEISSSDTRTAEVWQLSVEEIELLQKLQQHHEGMLSSGLTPYEWLGIFAETDEQRKHYAELFAKRQLELTDAILKFESASASRAMVRGMTAVANWWNAALRWQRSVRSIVHAAS